MSRTRPHTITVWPTTKAVRARCPRPGNQPATLLCNTQREARRLFDLLCRRSAAALTLSPGPHLLQLTTYDKPRQPAYTVEATTYA